MGRLFPDNGRESSEKQPTGISCWSRCTGCLIIRKNRLNLFRGFNGKRQQQCGKALQLLKTVCHPDWNSVVNNGVSLCAKDRECAVGAVFELMLAGTAANFFPNRAEPCFHHRKVSIGEDTSRQAVAAGQSLSNGQFHREQSIGYAVLLNNITLWRLVRFNPVPPGSSKPSCFPSTRCAMVSQRIGFQPAA